MDAGLRVSNDTNKVQIDSTFRNSCYEKTISGVGTWEVPVDQSKMYVLEPPAGASVGVAPFAKSDTEPYYRIYGAAKLHVYGDLPTTSGSGYGLQVYNASGGLVFDSSKAPLKVIDYVYGNLGPVSMNIKVNLDVPLQSKTYSTRRLGVLLGQTPVGLNWYGGTQKFSGCFFTVTDFTVGLRFKHMFTNSDLSVALNDFNSYWVTDMYSYIVVGLDGIPTS